MKPATPLPELVAALEDFVGACLPWELTRAEETARTVLEKARQE